MTPVCAVLTDLCHPRDGRVEVTYASDADDPDVWRITTCFGDDGRAVGFAIEWNDGDPEAWTALADGLQQAFIEQFREARPVCRVHPHPLDPRVVDGEARWVCPASGAPVASIGALS